MGVNEKARVKIFKYNPETDEKPTYVEYEVPVWERMKVLEVLQYVRENYEPIAFRYGCRSKLCGTCAVLVNGRPVLACDCDVEEYMVIEPLPGFKIIRDLVVDLSPLDVKLEFLRPGIKPKPKIRQIPVEAIEKCRIYSDCIYCGVCMSACPVVRTAEEEFLGPAPYYYIGRYQYDPRDTTNRLKEFFEGGVFNCLSCYLCEENCPYQIHVARLGIENIKNLCFSEGLRIRYVESLLELIRSKGQVSSSELFLKTQGLRAILKIPWMLKTLRRKAIPILPRPPIKSIKNVEEIFRRVVKVG